MYIKVILATDYNYGIGKNGVIPWHCKEDLEFFKKKTIGKTLVFGRNTLETLPFLKDRNIYCLTRKYANGKATTIGKNNCICINSIEDIPCNKIWIAGGAKVYNTVFKDYPNCISKIYFTTILNTFDCDTFIDRVITRKLLSSMKKTRLAINKEFSIIKYGIKNDNPLLVI